MQPKAVKKYNLLQASEKLKVSPATLRNWLKAGLLPVRGQGRHDFIPSHELSKFKLKLASGKISKLRKRANKNISEAKHTHAELLQNILNEKPLQKLISASAHDMKCLLMAIYLLQLQQRKLCRLDGETIILKNQRLANEIKQWGINSNSPSLKQKIKYVEAVKLDLNDSLLSYVYQSSNSVGRKQKSGAYYSPAPLIKKLVRTVIVSPGPVLDPCCGGGQFLIECLRHYESLGESRPWRYIFGADIDTIAVLIARANLTLASGGRADSVSQIRQQDALSGVGWSKSFQYILTNPPWGGSLRSSQLADLKKKFPMLKSGETFSYFTAASMMLLKNGGKLGFVLPDAFLNVKAHADIRKHILQNYKINEIARCEEKFSGVFTKSFTIQIEKLKAGPQHRIKINNGKTEFTKKYEEILNSEEAGISIDSDADTEKHLRQIEQRAFLSLKNNADWTLGIVTGNNEKFLRNKKSELFEPVYKGTDVLRFNLLPPTKFLHFKQKKMQQVAPIERYRCAEKLIYRFICKELVFAIDRSGSCTLNSANILVPKIPGYSMRAVCGILNSSLAQFYYHKKFNTFKTLKGNLEKFPFPKPTPGLVKAIEEVVARLELSFNEQDFSVLNHLVMDLYEVDSQLRQHLNKLTLSKSFAGPY